MTEERTPEDGPAEEGTAASEGAERAAPPPGPLSGARRFFTRHRKRILRVGLIGFAVVVLLDLSGSLPTETTVDLALGDAHRGAVALRVEILDEAGEAARVVRLAFPDGVPSHVVETLDLAPGAYRVHVETERADGSVRALEGSLVAPAEGTVLVSLRPVS